MAQDAFKYDAAISLLGADEDFAERLVSALRPLVRGEIFLYSRRQSELAATGELTTEFTRVFRGEARVVVVLYRPPQDGRAGWGETAYTSIEKDAILARRSRVTDVRWLVVISMIGLAIPEWYPDSQFRMSPETFTAEGIAAVIAERVSEAGGRVGLEGPVERARRLQAETARRDEIEARRHAEGGAGIETEASALFARLRELAGDIEGMSQHEHQRACAVNYRWASLVAQWTRQWSNVADGSELVIQVLDQNTGLQGHFHRVSEPRKLMTAHFDIALDAGGGWGWRPAKKSRAGSFGDREFVTTEELADWALNQLIDRAHGPGPRRP